MTDTRFTVTYRIATADRSDAEARAEAIALEQTVEIPRDVVPKGYVEDVILARVEELTPSGPSHFDATISYSPDSVGRELPQLLNVIFGNSSLQQGLKVVGLNPGPALTSRFPGARFGAEGLRKLSGRDAGGFVCPVIKPQGASTEDLARLARTCAEAGADIVKEDHGVANQASAPFRERVRAIAQEISAVNAGRDRPTLYFANVAGHGGEVRDLALHAQDCGAHGVLIMPGLYGFDAIGQLARDPEFILPIMAHPSFLGTHVASPDSGLAHAILFGTLMRLAGADISIFPNYGGRFGFTQPDCNAIATACADPGGIGRPILPSPGGGMTIERMPELASAYGPDAVYLLGGSLLRLGERIGEGIADIRAVLDAAV